MAENESYLVLESEDLQSLQPFQLAPLLYPDLQLSQTGEGQCAGPITKNHDQACSPDGPDGKDISRHPHTSGIRTYLERDCMDPPPRGW